MSIFLGPVTELWKQTLSQKAQVHITIWDADIVVFSQGTT